MEPHAVYHQRLRAIVEQIKSMSELEVILQWKKDLEPYTTNFLAQQISDLTDDQVKSLLGAPNPPTISQLQSLRHDRGLV